jgi:hypothetical protein
VLSKEQGMLVSPLVLIFILLRPGRVGKQDSILIVTLCICLAAYVAVREHFLPFEWDRSLLDWTINPMAPGPDHPHGGSVSADAWLMPIALLGRYAALLIAPVRLSLDYGGRIIGWHVSPGDPYLYVGIVAILSWCILFLVALRRRWYAGAFVAIGLALTYAMVSNFLVLIGTNFAERLAYIPSAFLLILVGAGAARLPGKTPIVLVTAVVGLFSLRTITYEIRWNDTLPFYATSLAEQPESIRLRILLADEYRRRGDLASAERVVSEAREKLPEYWDVWLQSAQIAMDQGKFDEAEAYLSRASRISRPRADLWSQELARRRMAATRQN